jgi:hypothetical protein
VSTVPDNVVYLRPRRRAAAPARLKIWACSCGSRTFFLYSDGSVQCSDCLEQSLKMKCTAATGPLDRR